MDKIIKIFLIVIALYSCNNVAKIDTIENPKTVETLTQKNTLHIEAEQTSIEPKIGCYYELDEKYSDSPDEKEIEMWWNGKLELVKEAGIQDDILSSGGAGPNGAEWGTYTDLYFVVLFPTELNLNYDSDNENFDPVTVTLNEKPINYKLINRQSYANGILVDFMLEKEVWTYALRPIKSEDYIPLYGKERVGASKKGESVFIAPMNTGEVFKIAVEIELENRKKYTTTAYFHVAYGDC